MIQVGQKVKFNPFKGINITGLPVNSTKETGRVVEVYEDHRWFSVEYGENKQRISFNFVDIGENVELL